MMRQSFGWLLTILTLAAPALELQAADTKRPNVLFIAVDDLNDWISCLGGHPDCKTPNIDAIAARGTRFTRAYCQGTYCGPSRASFMSGYYPHATGALGYASPRPKIGTRATWAQHYKDQGYYTARVGKIYHMGVPGGVELRIRSSETGAERLVEIM